MIRMFVKQMSVMRGDKQASAHRPECGGGGDTPTEFLKCFEAAYPLSRHGSCQRIPWKAVFLFHYISLYPVLKSLPTNKSKASNQLIKEKKEKEKKNGKEMKRTGKGRRGRNKNRKIRTPFYWPDTETFQIIPAVTWTHLEGTNTRKDLGIPHFPDIKHIEHP